jgi:hypothetical protein
MQLLLRALRNAQRDAGVDAHLPWFVTVVLRARASAAGVRSGNDPALRIVLSVRDRVIRSISPV